MTFPRFYLYFWFFVVSQFYFLSSPVHALYPVVIKKAELGTPPRKVAPIRDVDWHTNDIENVDGIVCDGSQTISQTFDPKFRTVKSTTTDPTTGVVTTTETQVAEPYPVTQILGNIVSSKFYSSPALVSMSQHLQGVYKTFYNNPEGTRKAFLSMDVNNPNGYAGIDDKATNYKQQLCYKGQRIVRALQGGDQVVVNEKIAWKCGSNFVKATDGFPRNPGGCTIVTLEDIAAAYDPNLAPTGDLTTCSPISPPQEVFFDPADNCSYANSDDPAYPAPTPGPISQFAPASNKAGLTANEACVLYHNVVRSADSGSLARLYTIWDRNMNTGTYENPKKKKVSMPRGSIAATYQPFASFGISNHQTLKNHDVCAVDTGKKDIDKPNILNVAAAILNAWGTVNELSQTFSGSTKTSYKIDKRVNFDKDQAMLNNFLTLSYQKEKNTVDLPGSYTQDSINIDPGIIVTRAEFAKMVLPYSWH